MDRKRDWKESKLLAPLRRPYRIGRAGLTRLLHPLRRSLLTRRLKKKGFLRRVLVVCHGNICRSPYGAARLTRLGDPEPNLEVRSAGFLDAGHPSPDAAVSAAAQRGLDLTDHRSKTLSQELVDWADLIVIMDPVQEREIHNQFGPVSAIVFILGDLDPESTGKREIPDPVGRTEAVFLEVYERMDRCLTQLRDMTRVAA